MCAQVDAHFSQVITCDLKQPISPTLWGCSPSPSHPLGYLSFDISLSRTASRIVKVMLVAFAAFSSGTLRSFRSGKERAKISWNYASSSGEWARYHDKNITYP